MTTFHAADQLAHGNVILARFAKAPAALEKARGAFEAAQLALAKASDAAAAAREARDSALAAIGAADDALDTALLALANKMVGAAMGTRKNPFSGFSAKAPGALVEMAYASEVKEALALCARIEKARPPADVAKAVASCKKLAGTVTKALAALSGPQLAYTRALAARDSLLPGWTKALQSLKRRAYAELEDDRAVRALFAPPDRVQDPRKKRPARKVAAPPATPKP